jgi:hypothetical protein
MADRKEDSGNSGTTSLERWRRRQRPRTSTPEHVAQRYFENTREDTDAASSIGQATPRAEGQPQAGTPPAGPTPMQAPRLPTRGVILRTRCVPSHSASESRPVARPATASLPQAIVTLRTARRAGSSTTGGLSHERSTPSSPRRWPGSGRTQSAIGTRAQAGVPETPPPGSVPSRSRPSGISLCPASQSGSAELESGYAPSGSDSSGSDTSGRGSSGAASSGLSLSTSGQSGEHSDEMYRASRSWPRFVSHEWGSSECEQSVQSSSRWGSPGSD